MERYQKETPTPVFSCKYYENFKMTNFEHLRTTASTRYYFDKINLKQSGFCTHYSLKILVSESNIKVISKIVNLKNTFYSSHIYVYLRFYCQILRFYKDFKDGNLWVFLICTQFTQQEYWICH